MMFDCDVAVIGGGPAGSTAAAWLARSGRRVALFERDRFPRFHIGESLLASVNDVLEAIGAAELIRAQRFPVKWGATFMTPDGAIERFADFAIAAGEVAQPQTWQVCREQFDECLLRHAANCGADVVEGHRVLDIVFDGGGVDLTVACAGEPEGAPEKQTMRVRARAVIDASGRASLLSRRFSLVRHEPDLANVAVFSHYASVPRREGRRAGDIRVIARADLGWFWMIPISDELMSVGAVLPRDAFKALPRAEPDALLAQLVAGTPAVARLMTQAVRRWPVRVESDFSYGARRYAGDRWILVGDAGSFLDPVFSSGVAIALESGLEGAQAIAAGLTNGDLSARAFRRFDRRQRARYQSLRRVVRGFYTPAVRDLFFSPDPPKRMFHGVVSVLAGAWRPSLVIRAWVHLFFLSVRLQARFGFSPSHLSSPSHQLAAVQAIEAGRENGLERQA
jgi:flavin-dependent dehydrogenase